MFTKQSIKSPIAVREFLDHRGVEWILRLQGEILKISCDIGVARIMGKARDLRRSHQRVEIFFSQVLLHPFIILLHFEQTAQGIGDLLKIGRRSQVADLV